MHEDVPRLPQLKNARLPSCFCKWVDNHPLENLSKRYETLTASKAQCLSVTSATAQSIACKLLHKPLAIRKKVSVNACLCKATLDDANVCETRTFAKLRRRFPCSDDICHISLDSRHDSELEIILYEEDVENDLIDVLLEYQQCQMECNHEVCSDSDDFQDTVPVADPRLSSSRYGARGSIAMSLLLPSDAEQMLRVRLPISQSVDITHTLSFFVYQVYVRKPPLCHLVCLMNYVCYIQT